MIENKDLKEEDKLKQEIEDKLPKEESKDSKKKKSKKKNKELDESFDIRGTQTLFRTLSRNHYNLLRMVDNKSNIVLTMNSIIISLLLGAGFVANEDEKALIHSMAPILINFCMVSMIFALISMLPHKYLGKAYKRSGYNGSLYAGNYAKYSLEDFEKNFERIMSSGKNTYNEMIKDFYFLGQSLYVKQKLLWISVIVFLLGMITSIVYYNVNSLFLP